MMQEVIRVATQAREELVDVTSSVRAAVQSSGVQEGLVNVYAQGATAAMMI